MPEFLALAFTGQGPPLEPVTVETIYVPAVSGRIRWDLSPGSATEVATNTSVGTHDGADTTLDHASGALGAGLAYSVGYSIGTTSVTLIASVTIRFRYRVTATQGASVALYELQAAYDNSNINDSLVTPVEFDWTWFEYTMENDPSTGLPWANAAAISAKKWGFDFNSGAVDGISTFKCSEIELVVVRT